MRRPAPITVAELASRRTAVAALVVHEVATAVAAPVTAVPTGATPGGAVADVLTPAIGESAREVVRAALGTATTTTTAVLASGAGGLPSVPSGRRGQLLRACHARADPGLAFPVPSSTATMAVAVAPAVPTRIGAVAGSAEGGA